MLHLVGYLWNTFAMHGPLKVKLMGKYLQLYPIVSFEVFPVYYPLTSHYPTMCYIV